MALMRPSNIASSILIVYFIRDFLKLIGVASVAGVVVALLWLLREVEEGIRARRGFREDLKE